MKEQIEKLAGLLWAYCRYSNPEALTHDVMLKRFNCQHPGSRSLWLERASNITNTLGYRLIEGDEDGLLSKADREKCMPTEKEIDIYLTTPDDEVCAKLRAELTIDDFRKLAMVILYTENLLKAQQALTQRKTADEIFAEIDTCEIRTDVFQEDGSKILDKGDIVIPQLYYKHSLKSRYIADKGAENVK